MNDIFQQLGIFISGLLASYLGMYIVGGISSLSILFLLGLGLNPSVANSTYQIGNLFSNLGGVKYFIRSNNYQKKHIIPMFFIMFTGGYLGSLFLLDLEKNTVYKILGVIYILLAFFEIFNKYIEVEKEKNISVIQTYFGYFSIWIISIWSAIFPAGNGVFFYQIYRRFFGMTPLMAKGHQKFVINGLFLGVLPNIVIAGVFNIKYVVLFSLGMYIGGTFAAKHVIKAGNKILQISIIIGMFIVGLYFLFGK